MNGLLIINKPSGISSASAVAKVKHLLRQQNKESNISDNSYKVGHMGTLDPMASGVLLVGVGKATRLFDLFLSHNKRYIAEFIFGHTTDTLDITGQIVQNTSVIPNIQQIIDVLPSLCGVVSQMPPQFSAKSVNGVKAYKIARTGGSIDLQPKNVHIHNIQYLSQTDINTHSFTINCSSGTYIRSICRDLANALGSFATMSRLQRIKCGNYTLQEAINIDSQFLVQNSLIPLSKILQDYEFLSIIDIPDKYFDKLKNGVKISTQDIIFQAIQQPFALYCKGQLFGIASIIDGKIVLTTNLFTSSLDEYD